MHTQSYFKKTKLLLGALAASSILALVGCAGNSPSSQFAVATQAINAAETAGATELAPLEMRSARTKMHDAEQAGYERDYKKAKDLAEQAEWDARVAERKAQAEKAKRAVEDAKRGVEDLRHESLRDQ